MPRAWYKYDINSTGTGAALVAANYFRPPGGSFDCQPDFNACTIYVYYGLALGSAPANPPAPLSARIQSYIKANIATAQNRPATGKVFAYSGPLS